VLYTYPRPLMKIHKYSAKMNSKSGD